MSQPLHPRQGLPRAVDNQYLFSDHTLANLLPRDPRWRAALSAAREVHAWLQDLYEQEKAQLPNYNEAQLEAHWIRPILQRLGHTFEPQATVPRISFTTLLSNHTHYLKKAQKLYQRYCDKDDLACVAGFVDHHLQEEQSDVVHDLLAFLAQQIIDMNKEKQEVTEAFWLDLEGVTDADTFDTLRNRGKWESTLWKSEACRPFVDEDSRSTRSLDESLAWNVAAFKAFVKALAGSLANLSAIVDVYKAHHPRYQALAARLQQTDRLIDQVVYRLYDLTEEEIAIVEA